MNDLDPELGIFDRKRLFSDSAIWTFAFVGLAILVGVMSLMWDSSGYLIEEWSGGRIIVVLIAAIYGLVLGWMIFPRIGARLND